MQFQFLREVDNKMIFVGEKAAYERILEGCKELKKYGVRAVTGACGFFGHYQKRLAAKLDIPVALSSLVQLPWIAAMLKPDENRRPDGERGVLRAGSAARVQRAG